MAKLLGWGCLLLIAAAAFAMMGCNRKSEKTIQDTPWSRISVDYCVGNGPNVKLKTWTTEDAATLEKLRGAFQVLSRKGLSLIATMTTNEIRLSAAGGDEFVLYVFEDTKLSCYDARNRKDSISLEVAECFVQELTKAIEAAGGDEVHFVYKYDVNVMK